MSRCDVCDGPATKFVTSNYAWGGNPAYGSFRSFRCDEHADEAIKQLHAAGASASVQPLHREEPRDPTDSDLFGGGESQSYRDAMIDSGRGHLLR